MSLIPFGFWAASGGGAAGAFDLLETTTLTTSASSVTFSGLDAYSDYKHLQIRMVTRANNVSANWIKTGFQFNNSTTTLYSGHELFGNGSSVSSQNEINTTFAYGGVTPDGANDANTYGASCVDFLDYASSSKNTTVRGLAGQSTTYSNFIGLSSGLWRSTAAVTQIKVLLESESFVAGSRFSLYGVK